MASLSIANFYFHGHFWSPLPANGRSRSISGKEGVRNLIWSANYLISLDTSLWNHSCTRKVQVAYCSRLDFVWFLVHVHRLQRVLFPYAFTRSSQSFLRSLKDRKTTRYYSQGPFLVLLFLQTLLSMPVLQLPPPKVLLKLQGLRRTCLAEDSESSQRSLHSRLAGHNRDMIGHFFLDFLVVKVEAVVVLSPDVEMSIEATLALSSSSSA